MKIYRDSMFIEPAYRDILAHARLNAVDRVLEALGDEVVAWSRSTDTIRVRLAHSANWTGAVYIKRYHYRRWKNRLKAMLRGTFFGRPRSRVEFEALTVMRKLGIPAVRPIACGERRCGHFVAKCFLITEAVPDSLSLATFAIALDGKQQTRLPQKKRQRLIVELARKVRDMHDAGFAHGGLFWRNVLLRTIPEGGHEYHFLDASPGKRVWKKETFEPNKVDDIAALKTLAATFCNRTDRIRFAKAYLRVERFDARHRDWFDQIEQRAQNHRQHEMYRLKMSRLFYLHAQNLHDAEQNSEPALETAPALHTSHP